MAAQNWLVVAWRKENPLQQSSIPTIDVAEVVGGMPHLSLFSGFCYYMYSEARVAKTRQREVSQFDGEQVNQIFQCKTSLNILYFLEKGGLVLFKLPTE